MAGCKWFLLTIKSINRDKMAPEGFFPPPELLQFDPPFLSSLPNLPPVDLPSKFVAACLHSMSLIHHVAHGCEKSKQNIHKIYSADAFNGHQLWLHSNSCGHQRDALKGQFNYIITMQSREISQMMRIFLSPQSAAKICKELSRKQQAHCRTAKIKQDKSHLKRYKVTHLL